MSGIGLASAVMQGEDEVFILPVYYVGGTTTRSLTSEQFVGSLQEAGVRARFVESYDSLEQLLVKEACTGDIIIYMGARDPEIPVAADRLATALEAS